MLAKPRKVLGALLGFGALLAVIPSAAAELEDTQHPFRVGPDATSALVTGGGGVLYSLETTAQGVNCTSVTAWDSPDGTTTHGQAVVIAEGAALSGTSVATGPIHRPFRYGLVVQAANGCVGTGSYGN